MIFEVLTTSPPAGSSVLYCVLFTGEQHRGVSLLSMSELCPQLRPYQRHWPTTSIIITVSRASQHRSYHIASQTCCNWLDDLCLLQCESKKSPPAIFRHFFQNGWEFLIKFLYTYYAFLCTLDYKFAFNYLQLWRSYATLSEATHRIFYISLELNF